MPCHALSFLAMACWALPYRIMSCHDLSFCIIGDALFAQQPVAHDPDRPGSELSLQWRSSWLIITCHILSLLSNAIPPYHRLSQGGVPGLLPWKPSSLLAATTIQVRLRGWLMLQGWLFCEAARLAVA